MQDLLEVRGRNSQSEDGSIAVHFWRDGGVERVCDSEFTGQCHYAWLVRKISRHEDIGDADLQSLRFQKSNSALQRSWKLSNGIVNLGPMRVDADLNLLDSELTKSSGLLLADHDAVGLYFYVEQKLSRSFHDFKKIAAQKNFAAAEREKKNAGGGELGKNVEDLRRGHLAMVVMIEITMDAALVTAIGDIEMNAERQA